MLTTSADRVQTYAASMALLLKHGAAGVISHSWLLGDSPDWKAVV